VIDMEYLVAEYVLLRDYKKEETEKLKVYIEEHVQKRMDAIELEVLTFLRDSKQKNAKTEAGTASRVEDISVTITDAEAFRRHVIGTEQWELLDWRCNKTAINAIVKSDTTFDPVEIGVKRTVDWKLNVRRA
jgi:hypothetical protein